MSKNGKKQVELKCDRAPKVRNALALLAGVKLAFCQVLSFLLPIRTAFPCPTFFDVHLGFSESLGKSVGIHKTKNAFKLNSLLMSNARADVLMKISISTYSHSSRLS